MPRLHALGSIAEPDRGKLDNMKIVVFVKHVPDGQSDRRIEDGRLVRGEDDTLNEMDEYAIEAAVQLKEEVGGEVVAVTMGPQDAEEALTRALQMGADKGIHICDDDLAGCDAIATSRVLSAAIKRLSEDAEVDLVLAGMASLDGMTSAVPPAVATMMEWPMLSFAHQLQYDSALKSVQIQRKSDGVEETLEASLPAVVSVTDQINEPRYPSFKELKAARQKPTEEWDLGDLASGLQELGWSGTSHVRVLEAEAEVRKERGTIIEDTGDGAARLAQYLLEKLDQ